MYSKRHYIAGLFFVCGLALATAMQSRAQGDRPKPDFVEVPAGTYWPLLKNTNEPSEVAVEPFRLQAAPVTNAQFLEFVRTHPKWRRSKVTRLFADNNYLQHWKDDLELGPKAPPNAPVVNVSWFAARAYAAAQHARLPTIAEWERAAQPGFTEVDGRRDVVWTRAVEAWLAVPTPEIEPNVKQTRANFLGLYDLNLLVWEWVEDFNTSMVTGDSRGDSTLDRNLFCGAGAAGARDPSDYAAFLRGAMRSSLRADYCLPNLGFRCADSL
ncbi:MAG TPA: formylglycine-generating enzyme family protein [Opitutaceae bacterium]|nr:formylglycine-generating enzyme family protein [Opitutaceae bacterium]